MKPYQLLYNYTVLVNQLFEQTHYVSKISINHIFSSLISRLHPLSQPNKLITLDKSGM